MSKLRLRHGLAVVLAAAGAASLHAQSAGTAGYQLPPKVIVDILDAAPTPTVIVSPGRQNGGAARAAQHADDCRSRRADPPPGRLPDRSEDERPPAARRRRHRHHDDDVGGDGRSGVVHRDGVGECRTGRHRIGRIGLRDRQVSDGSRRKDGRAEQYCIVRRNRIRRRRLHCRGVQEVGSCRRNDSDLTARSAERASPRRCR